MSSWIPNLIRQPFSRFSVATKQEAKVNAILEGSFDEPEEKPSRSAEDSSQMDEELSNVDFPITDPSNGTPRATTPSGGPQSNRSKSSTSFSFWKKPSVITTNAGPKIRGAAYPPLQSSPSGEILAPSTPSSSSLPLPENTSDGGPTSPDGTDIPSSYNSSAAVLNPGNRDIFKVNVNTNSSSSSTMSRETSNTLSQPDTPTEGPPLVKRSDQVKLENYRRLLEEPNMDMGKLRKMSWGGIPWQMRGVVWQLLLGYLPTNKARREPTLERRRQEYAAFVSQYFDMPDSNHSEAEMVILRQIRVDVPRTSPGVDFFQFPIVQQALERVLYIWAIRHPASGYVQGINDLVTPFILVFLSTLIEIEPVLIKPADITLEQLTMVEAECLGCLTQLLDGIQDHYTFAQPGIQRMVYKLNELIGTIDADLNQHLDTEGVQFIQFAFRWMNCLLMREMSFSLTLRLWDTYLAEDGGDGFKTFHVYVCAAFLMHWSEQLKKLDFQELVLFLQHVPTKDWTLTDLETILSQAYIYKHLYHESPHHLQ